MSSSVRMTVAQMQEAAKAGAFIELVYVPTLTKESINRKAQFSIADVANTIRKVGPEFVDHMTKENPARLLGLPVVGVDGEVAVEMNLRQPKEVHETFYHPGPPRRTGRL